MGHSATQTITCVPGSLHRRPRAGHLDSYSMTIACITWNSEHRQLPCCLSTTAAAGSCVQGIRLLICLPTRYRSSCITCRNSFALRTPMRMRTKEARAASSMNHPHIQQAYTRIKKLNGPVSHPPSYSLFIQHEAHFMLCSCKVDTCAGQ